MPAWCSDPKADFACKEQSQSRFESSRSLFAFSLCIYFVRSFLGVLPFFIIFYYFCLFPLFSLLTLYSFARFLACSRRSDSGARLGLATSCSATF